MPAIESQIGEQVETAGKPAQMEPYDHAPHGWQPYKPSDAAPWNLRRVVHLHRRAAFAAPWRVLQRDLRDGPTAAVDRLLDARSSDGREIPFSSIASTIGEAATASGSPDRLKAWWLYRMLLSPDPLTERLTLMWHNHFATSNRKVANLILMRQQNELFRQYAMAPFGELLSAIVKSPAMLIWLDADSNQKGHPNENLARELLELFSLGIDNFVEDDVKAAARALTGWSVSQDTFVMNEKHHDDGEIAIFKKRGSMTGDDLLELLIDHPATAHRLAWRICQTLMGENAVDEPALESLAAGLRERQLDVGWGVETVLRSERFFSDANIGTRVSGPAEYVVGTLRALGLCDRPPSTLVVAEWVSRMGQDLFYPPNVGGWSEGRSWLGSRSIVARANFARALADGRLWHPRRTPDLDQLVDDLSAHGDISRSVAESSSDRELARRVTSIARLLWGDAPTTLVSELIAITSAADSQSEILAILLSRPENYLA